MHHDFAELKEELDKQATVYRFHRFQSGPSFSALT
jgi:hypothetical protein